MRKLLTIIIGLLALFADAQGIGQQLRSITGLVSKQNLVSRWRPELGTTNDVFGSSPMTLKNGATATYGTGLVCSSPTTNHARFVAPSTIMSKDRGTIECWYRGTNIMTGQLISVAEPDGDPHGHLSIGDITGSLANERVTLGMVAGGALFVIGWVTNNTAVLHDGAWHHIVASSSGTAWTLYVDGVSRPLSVGFGSNNGYFLTDGVGAATNRFLCFGNRADGNGQLNCDIADIKWYSQPSTAAEVRKRYEYGRHRP